MLRSRSQLTDYINRFLPLAQEMSQQSYEIERLQSTLHNFNGHRLELVDLYDGFVSQFTGGMFSWSYMLKITSIIIWSAISPIGSYPRACDFDLIWIRMVGDAYLAEYMFYVSLILLVHAIPPGYVCYLIYPLYGIWYGKHFLF